MPTLLGTCRAFAALALCAACGCSSTQPEFLWLDGYLGAVAAQDRGHIDEAAARYEVLAETTPDPTRRRMVRYRQGTLAEASGQPERARGIYAELVAHPSGDDWGARAAWSLWELDGERALLPTIIDRYGNSTAAQHAVDAIVRLAKKEGALAQAAAELEGLQPLAEGDIQDYLIFERALLHQEHLGQPERARALWSKVIEGWGDEGLADNARWQIGRSFEAQQKWPQALDAYAELIDHHKENSWFMGDYNSDRADDARWRRAQIFERTGDTKRAIVEYDRFVDEFPHNLKADDAAWRIVELERAAGQKDVAGLRDFLQAWPRSRYAPRAKRLLGGGA